MAKRKNANEQMKAWMDGISKMELNLEDKKQPYIDEATYDKLHMAYSMMKDLLIEMNSFGDLESYDTEDIFKMIGEMEQNN